MKKKILYIVTAFCLLMIGVLIQKYYGLGNLIPAKPVKEIMNTINKGDEGKLEIYILAGQSNMEGYGKIEDYTQPQLDRGIYIFNNKYEWKQGKEPVGYLIGPSIAFASKVSTNSNSIGIINVARGGTSLSDWNWSCKDHSLYQQMLKRALAASSQGEIKGLLFFQGEEDALFGSVLGHNNWTEGFEQFVKAIRKDLKSPNLPIVFAQIGKGHSSFWKQIQKNQKNVKINNVAMIQTDDLTYGADSLHFTTESYQVIGERFALKMNELLIFDSEKE